MRATLPGTMPLRVSTSATWPILMSLVCVSAIRNSAFSTVGIRHAREVGARGDLLSDFDRQTWKHARHAGLDLQVVELAHAQFVGGPALVDFGFLRRDLRLEPAFAISSCFCAMLRRFFISFAVP